MENSWDVDCEDILECIRINSHNLSEYHKKRYYYYKGMLKYFKIPIIILSSVTSVISVGLSIYIQQKTVSLVTCLLSLVSAIIGSVELYLGIQKTMENELESSKQFKILSYDIYKTLNLQRQHRFVNGKTYLDDKYNEYIKIIEQSSLEINKIKDALAPIPKEFRSKHNMLKTVSSELFINVPNNSPNDSRNSSIESNNILKENVYDYYTNKC